MYNIILYPKIKSHSDSLQLLKIKTVRVTQKLVCTHSHTSEYHMDDVCQSLSYSDSGPPMV